jgi:hypothetical protein
MEADIKQNGATEASAAFSTESARPPLKKPSGATRAFPRPVQ